MVNADPSDLAEQVRAAVLGAALAAYEDAGMRGVCAEGAWEAALGAMRTLDLSRLVNQADGLQGHRVVRRREEPI